TLIFYSSPSHRDLHSFPTRRSSDLPFIVFIVRPTICHEPLKKILDFMNSRPHPVNAFIVPDAMISPITPRALGNLNNHARLIVRSEEHTSELQSLAYLVCRILLEKK